MITPRFQLAVALILTALVSGTGATCARRPMVTNYTPPPVIFNRTPTTAELAEVINRTDQITKLQSNSTTIQVTSMAALPRLNANVAIERPRRIRIQAAVPLLPGSGLDLGSNDQFYWMRVPELSGPTLYYAAHSNTLGTYRADLLSVEPVWLIDALGLARIDTAIPHTEPVVQANGLLEVRSAAIVGGSMGQRVLLIDQQTGTIQSQYLLGGDGQVRAHAEASMFEHFPNGQYSLPHRVKLTLTAGGQPMEMLIDVGDWVVNQLLTNDPNQFSMPESSSDRKIDVSSPATAAIPVSPSASGYVAADPTGLPLRGTERR